MIQTTRIRAARAVGQLTTLVLIAGALNLGMAAPLHAAVPVATPAAEAVIGQLGARPGATRLPLPVSDQVKASLDVGTGNLMVSINALTLPGITGDASLGMVYNSRSGQSGPAHIQPRWNLALGAAGALSSTASGVLFTSGDGYSALFTPVPGSATAFTPPAGVKADRRKPAPATR